MENPSVSVYERVLGPHPPYDPDKFDNPNDYRDDQYINAYNFVTGQELTSQEIASRQGYLFGLPAHERDRDQIEEIAVMDALYDIIGGNVKTAQTNALMSWPQFQELFEKYGQQMGGAAVMVGSISVLSSVAFNRLAEDVYGAERKIVMDIVGGHHKTHTGNFVFGDARKLPFEAGSVSYLHVDRLLSSLSDDKQALMDDLPSILTTLAGEFSRVLAPGGQLLMKETTPTFNPEWPPEIQTEVMQLFADLIDGSMNGAGLPVHYAQTRIPGDIRFWHDPRRRTESLPTNLVFGLMVYGRKPAV